MVCIISMLRAVLGAKVLSYSFSKGCKVYIAFALLVNRYFAFLYSSFIRKSIILIKDTSFPTELNKAHLVFEHLNFRCVQFSLYLMHTLALNGFGFIIIFFVSVLFIRLL